MNGMICPASELERKKPGKRLAGMSLTELLCVIAIMAILASFYLGAILRAFSRVLKFLKGS
jgi:prepilin-type N-terminal cleavage/methylation domain-containing protein